MRSIQRQAERVIQSGLCHVQLRRAFDALFAHRRGMDSDGQAHLRLSPYRHSRRFSARARSASTERTLCSEASSSALASTAFQYVRTTFAIRFICVRRFSSVLIVRFVSADFVARRVFPAS